jgi:1-aminocyclopropane-1-carboxylate deaminase
MMGAIPRLDPSEFGIGHKHTLQNLTAEVLAAGGKPYYIPAGASDHHLGGLGFARWAFEVAAQEEELGVFFDTIIVCAVTGSTFAGMITGFKLLSKIAGPSSRKRRIIRIDASANPEETRQQVLRIAKFTAAKIGLGEGDIGDVELDERYHDGVYGIAGERTVEAMRSGTETEGFITDPVYEGKSLAGMMDLVRGRLGRGVQCYMHILGGSWL